MGVEDSVATVDGVKCLYVREDAKTAAGSGRLVPIADTLAARVPLHELPSPPNLDYSGQDIGKRFGRPKTKLGFGKQHVFHSMRKTAATVFEQAGVPEGVTADIIGHEKQAMTYRLYSGVASVKQRHEAIVEFERLMLEKEAEANVVSFTGYKT